MHRSYAAVKREFSAYKNSSTYMYRCIGNRLHTHESGFVTNDLKAAAERNVSLAIFILRQFQG